MKKRYTISLLFIPSLIVTGQEFKSIALSIIGRYDKHADYLERYTDRTYEENIRQWQKLWNYS